MTEHERALSAITLWYHGDVAAAKLALRSLSGPALGRFSGVICDMLPELKRQCNAELRGTRVQSPRQDTREHRPRENTI